MKHLILLAGIAISATVVVACIASAAEPVTIDNFCRAETDGYLQKRTDDGHFGRIKPLREPVTVDSQPVVRANRDTLYSYGVFDLTHPVTITMPDAGDRFMSLRAVNQDHYIVSNTYDAGPREFTQQSVGTRYLYVAVRVLVDPDDPKDLTIARPTAGCGQMDPEGCRQTGTARLEPGTARRIAQSDPRHGPLRAGQQTHVRSEKRSRPNPPSHRYCRWLGRRPGMGVLLHQRDAQGKRWHTAPHPSCTGRTSGWLLVDYRV